MSFDPFLGDELHKLVCLQQVSLPPPPLTQPAPAPATAPAQRPIILQSAFKPYNYSGRIYKKMKPSLAGKEISFDLGCGRGEKGSMNKRLLAFLRKVWIEKKNQQLQQQQQPEESSIRKKHVMNERIRREKQKLCFKELHSILPMGTKNDKISIVKVAATEIQNLIRCRDELERRNKELKAKISSLTASTVSNCGESIRADESTNYASRRWK